MAEPDFSDAEKVAIRKLLVEGSVWSRMQDALETNPKTAGGYLQRQRSVAILVFGGS